MLFQIIGAVKNKVHFILFGALLSCLVLFSTFLYYGSTIREISKLTMSQAKVENFSVSDNISKKLKNFEFGRAKKSLLDNRDFLGNVLGYKDFEEAITQAQAYPKYEQLLQVIRDKNKKFHLYVSSRSKSIDKQLIDLDKKLQDHIAYSQRDSNFHKFIENRFEKVKRISRNTSLSRKVRKEIDIYLETFSKELSLLNQVIVAKKETYTLANRFEKEFQKLARNLSSVIAHKSKISTFIEIGALVVMGLVALSLLLLLALSFSTKRGLFKNINNEIEHWLIDYSRNLLESSSLELKGASSDFSSRVEQLTMKYKELRSVGELVENRFPFPVVLSNQQGEIEWENKAHNDLLENFSGERISDLWKTQDGLWLNDNQVEGVCELKDGAEGKYEYFVVPMNRHKKYFMVFTPLARVEKTQSKILENYAQPIEQALDGILNYQFQPKNFEWKSYPETVQTILGQVTSIHSMILSERHSFEKSLQKLVETNEKVELKQEDLVNVNNEIAGRLNFYRDRVNHMKTLYLQMVEKQDIASDIITSTVTGHDHMMSNSIGYHAKVSKHVEATSKSVDKFQSVLAEIISEQAQPNIKLSKLKMYLDEVVYTIKSLEQVESSGNFDSQFNSKAMTLRYEELSQELTMIDKDVIELIGELYQDIMHLHYRVGSNSSEKQSKQAREPRASETV